MRITNERAAVEYVTQLLTAYGTVTTGVTKIDDDTVSVWAGVSMLAEDAENLKDGEEV